MRHFGRFVRGSLFKVFQHPTVTCGSAFLGTGWWNSWWVEHPNQERKKYEAAALAQFYTAAHNAIPLCDYDGPVFKPNFNFEMAPKEPIALDSDKFAWLKYNFKTQPREYLDAVLQYCYEGNIKPNIEECFDVNESKRWFHAPWQHAGPSGREPCHGLTQERPSPPGWLHANQKHQQQTVAVGLYNNIASAVFYDVWKDPAEPNYKGKNGKGVLFDEGSVSFKLLFSDVKVEDAPYLATAPTWRVMTQSQNPSNTDPDPIREFNLVRLLQIDVAVKDSRDNRNGWVFGSFITDSSISHDNPWLRVIPIGLQWNNDTARTVSDKELPLTGGWLNENAKNRIITDARPFVGLDNRIGGPGITFLLLLVAMRRRGRGKTRFVADNFVSCCSACHMMAQYPSVRDMVVKAPAEPGVTDIGKSERNYFFQDLPCGEVFDDNMSYYAPTPPQHAYALDYSLQLQFGLNNWSGWRAASFPDQVSPELHELSIPGRKLLAHKEAHAQSASGDIPLKHTHSG